MYSVTELENADVSDDTSSGADKVTKLREEAPSGKIA